MKFNDTPHSQMLKILYYAISEVIYNKFPLIGIYVNSIFRKEETLKYISELDYIRLDQIDKDYIERK
jgi:hypothetical protein